MDCPLWVGTISWGHVTNVNTIKARPVQNLSEHLRLRGVNTCEELQKQFPSIDWQKHNIVAVTSLSDSDKKLLYDYGSYDYEYMNNVLRNYPDRPARINDIIALMTPLDKEIIVYRYVNDHSYLPKIPGTIFTSYGYLSTSMNIVHVMEAINDIPNSALMKIIVPSGKKALYLPNPREVELLFPHNIQLLLTGYELQENIPIYTLYML